MLLLEDSLQALTSDTFRDDPAGQARHQSHLETSLEPSVRRALSHGTGMPALVNWVHRALPRVTGGRMRGRPADYAGAVTQLLCRTLVERSRSAARAGWDTVVDR